MRYPILTASLVSCLFALSASAADCEFNVSRWPSFSATVKNGLGSYSCDYDRAEGGWWDYKCTLQARNAGAQPLSNAGTLYVNPDARVRPEGQFYAHGTFDETCLFNPELR